jgi:hypothetical protein
MGALVRIDRAERSSPVFLSTYNLLNLLRQTGELGLIAKPSLFNKPAYADSSWRTPANGIDIH